MSDLPVGTRDDDVLDLDVIESRWAPWVTDLVKTSAAEAGVAVANFRRMVRLGHVVFGQLPPAAQRRIRGIRWCAWHEKDHEVEHFTSGQRYCRRGMTDAQYLGRHPEKTKEQVMARSVRVYRRKAS